MATYTSWETDQLVTIRCRYADRPEMGCPDGSTAVAVALHGQWSGGDSDIDPIWVPVCRHHHDQWDIDYDTGEVTPEKYRLPCFAFLAQPIAAPTTDPKETP